MELFIKWVVRSARWSRCWTKEAVSLSQVCRLAGRTAAIATRKSQRRNGQIDKQPDPNSRPPLAKRKNLLHGPKEDKKTSDDEWYMCLHARTAASGIYF